ncbi:MAG: alpha/beta hydrolase [Hyphomicrobiales bacterium]|nr:alpha/beta hydrolase [Hyphomicrobiales bacterium]
MSDLFKGFNTHIVDTAGATIHARSGGAGPPLLLLHGYPQTHVMWHRIAPKLAERFTVVAADLRGYGDSSCPPSDPQRFTYSKRAMANDNVELMETFGFKDFRVVGHDRGGRVAYRMALDFPDRVNRLAVLDIIPTHAVWAGLTADNAMRLFHWLFLAQPEPLPETLIARAPVEFFDRICASWTKAGDLSAFSAEALTRYRLSFGDPLRIHAACEDYRSGRTYDDRADAADRDAGKQIGCPVLALWGKGGLAGEAQTPLGVWREWAGNVDGAEIDAGHFLPEENPAATVEALMAFLRK